LCVERALASFSRGTAVAPCPALPPNVAPTHVDPKGVAQLRTTGAAGLPGKSVTAVLRTLDDTLLSAFSRGSLTGLRGGTFAGTTSDFTLDRVVFVPGVVVSGRVDWTSGLASLTVRGKVAG